MGDDRGCCALCESASARLELRRRLDAFARRHLVFFGVLCIAYWIAFALGIATHFTQWLESDSFALFFLFVLCGFSLGFISSFCLAFAFDWWVGRAGEKISECPHRR